MTAPSDLALRQQRLILRSAALRADFADQAAVLEVPFATADRVHAGALWLRRHRDWVLAGALVVVLIRPRRAWSLVRFGWWAWRASRRAMPWLVTAGLLAPAGTAESRR